MNQNPYSVLGPTVPPMLGRRRVFRKLYQQLTKMTPDHITVIGPKHCGKTVLLKHLSERFSGQASDCIASPYIDLRHQTPCSDTEFTVRLVEAIRAALKAPRPDLADALRDTHNRQPLLDLVLADLEQHQQRVLVILDHFDHLLRDTRITSNLWDQLRDYAKRSSLTLVTGSRAPLRVLCRTAESEASDFWGLFNPIPVTLEPFAHEDWDDVFAPLADHKIGLESAASKEIINWTGGVPVLGVMLLQQLSDSKNSGEVIKKADVDTFAKRLVDAANELLSDLWDDCTAEAQRVLVTIAEGGMPKTEHANLVLKELKGRGYARVDGASVKSACRMMNDFARQQSATIADLWRLFSDEKDFAPRIRRVLDLRLEKLGKFDSTLKNHVAKMLRDLHPTPEDSITWARKVTDRAFDLIWRAELEPNLSVPASWIAEWKQHNNEWYQRNSWGGGPIPSGRGVQCGLLRIATGSAPGARRVTEYATGPTFRLLDHMQTIGNLASHLNPGEEVDLSFVVAACFTAVALCTNLGRDLPQ